MLTAVDLAWTAGFLEGEGSFTRWGTSETITASQVQPDPLLRLHALYGGKLYSYTQTNPKHSPYMRWHLSRLAARGLMMSIYGLMSPKRRQQIQKALAPWRATRPGERYRTHCPKGHPYSAENTLLNKTTNGRQCRICARVWISAWHKRKQAAKRRLHAVNQLDFTTDH